MNLYMFLYFVEINLINISFVSKSKNMSLFGSARMVNKKAIEKIVGYGDTYIEQHLENGYEKSRLTTDWWEGLKFLFDHVFYQGRSDKVSERVENEAITVLEKYVNENKENPEIILNKNNHEKITCDLEEVIGKGKVGRHRDIEMVISILKFISRIEDKNILKYSVSKIKNGYVRDHYEELQSIRSIGPKVSSFYLRDLIYMYSLDSYISKEDLIFLQPIDTWVRKVALKVKIIDNIDEDDTIVREKIVESCLNLNLSTTKFNQGSWYLGYNSFDILIDNLDKI